MVDRYLRVIGQYLSHLPDCGLLTPQSTNDEVAGCRALQFLGACYLCDLGCTIPYMHTVEDGENRLNLGLFAFYEACWPCMRVLELCCGYEKNDIQTIPRSMGFPAFPDHGDDHHRERLLHVTPPQPAVQMPASASR